MQNIHKKIETLANVSIILVALLLGVFLIRNYTFSSPSPNTMAERQTIKPGTKLTSTGIDWSKSERNLVLVLSTKCHFCADSMPFYQRLTKRGTKGTDMRIIAALPQETDESKRYLDEHAVNVDEIVKANPSELSVAGTPTLIMTDKNGVVLETWVGRLPSEKEEEVLKRAQGEIAGLTKK